MRCAFRILLGLAVLPFLAGQIPSGLDTTPSVTISLPANLLSETVQTSYFMTGTFGGYGGRTELRSDLRAYRINALADGQPATAIKIIVYAAGCDFKTFDLSLSQNRNLHERFVCAAIPKVSLSGQLPSELIGAHNTELVITYMAYWANEFFGIPDGAVTEFPLATVSPDENGMFQVELPDFSTSTTMASFRYGADLRLRLRDSKTLNHIAFNLAPELPEVRSQGGGLKIQSSYPASLKFTADSH